MVGKRFSKEKKLATAGEGVRFALVLSDSYLRASIALCSPRSIVMTVPALNRSTCSVCGRPVFADGVASVVEGGLDDARNCPVHEQLERMRTSSKRSMRDRYSDLAVRFRDFADFGALEIPGEMRQLKGELWEIKTSEDRILFYEVKPAGHKRAIRILDCFEKKFNKTPQGKAPRKIFDRGDWMIRRDKSYG